MVQNQDTLDKELERILDVNYYGIINVLTSSKHRYVTLTDFVTPEQIIAIEDTIQKLPELCTWEEVERTRPPSMSGLEWTPHLIRTYPENTLASNVLGFMRLRPEAAADRTLALKKNTMLQKELPSSSPTPTQHIPANLTQRLAQAWFWRLIVKYRPWLKVFWTVRLRKHNLQVERSSWWIQKPVKFLPWQLIMNPNEYWQPVETTNTASFNKAVDYTMKPDLFSKSLHMAAVDTGMVQPTTVYRHWLVWGGGGIIIKNWDNAWGQQDMIGCMRNSLNVCLANPVIWIGSNNILWLYQAIWIKPAYKILTLRVSSPRSGPSQVHSGFSKRAFNSFGQGIASYSDGHWFIEWPTMARSWHL